MGDIAADKVIDTFKNTGWKDYLVQAENSPDDLCYSPSLEIENKDNKHGITISAIGQPNNISYFIFYKRPKEVSRFFGLYKNTDQNYSTEISDQTEKDALDCLNALLKNDLQFLENKVK